MADSKRKRKDRMLQWRYDISIEQFEHLFTEQKGLCAICENPLTDFHGTTVDHDHKTHKVRGLVCHRCNLLVGWVEQSKERIPKVFSYLLRSL